MHNKQNNLSHNNKKTTPVPHKKYHHTTILSDFETRDKITPCNTTIQHENTRNFFYSPLSLSENIAVPQWYNYFLQDTLRRFLEHQQKIPYTPTIFYEFSENTYKSIGNQTVQTQKIHKQYKKNKKRFQSLYTKIIENIPICYQEQTLHAACNLFGHLFEKGHIKKESTIVYWDTHLGIHILPYEQKTIKQTLPYYQIKYFIDGKGISININTYCPYFLFSTVAIAVHPKDRRYKKYLDKEVLLPIINKKVPIIVDERINMLEGEGAFAVNPGHDPFSLTLAKDHCLPTHLTSIDKKGNFTTICGEFSGKNITEYKENIIKFLHDIGNLSILYEKEQDIYLNQQTDNILYPIYEENYQLVTSSLSHLSSCDSSHVASSESEIDYTTTKSLTTKNSMGGSYSFQVPDSINVSNQFKIGGLLPLLYNGKDILLFSEQGAIKTFTHEKTTPESFVMGLLLANILLEGRLSEEFFLEDLIQRLFEPSYTGTLMKYQSYLNIYRTYENKDISSGAETLYTLFQELYETNIHIPFLDLLEQTPYIKKKTQRKYSFSRETLLGSQYCDSPYRLQKNFYFDQHFLNSILIDQYNGSNPEMKPIVCYQDTTIPTLQMSTMLQILACNNHHLDMDSLWYFPGLHKKNGEYFTASNAKIEYNLLKDIEKKYGPDLLRYCCFKHQYIIPDQSEDIPYIKRLEQKIWNIMRYIIKEEKVNIDTQPDLEKNLSHLTEFDLWILRKTHNLSEHIQTLYSTMMIKDILPLLEEYILSPFDFYLEVQKEKSSPFSTSVLLHCFTIFLQHLELFFPVLCHNIAYYIPYNTVRNKTIAPTILEYKCNIFSDIIAKIQEIKINLGYMKHDAIDLILCTTGDIKQFLEEYNSLISKLISIKTLTLVDTTYTIPTNYKTTNIIDTKIGIKKVDTHISKKHSLENLQKEIAYIEDEIQRKKILLGRLVSLGDTRKVDEKKQEIQLLKERLESFKIEVTNIK